MKYVVSWELNANTGEEALARSLQVFSKWSPAEGNTFREFLGRVDGRGGFAVVETEEPALIAHDAAMFGSWFEFHVYPCLEVADSAAIDAEVVAQLASIS